MQYSPTKVEFVYSTFAGDPAYAGRIEQFVAEMPDRVEELLAAVRQEIWPEVVRQAQLLKIMATSHGFNQLAVAAADVEQTIGMNRPESLVHQAVNELICTCSRLKASHT
jgi:HPt (histidine-containing phosphotransfer) domain-containing protein